MPASIFNSEPASTYESEPISSETNNLVDQIQSIKVDDSALTEEILPEDPRVSKFTVINPAKVAGHIKYTVTGVDEQGDFTDIRRFREFHALYTVLKVRWPGCYIPALPEKKTMNTSDSVF